MSVKLHFLQSLVNYFPKNYGDLIEKQGECFHQDICICYQGWLEVNFLVDYCWYLKLDAVAAEEVPEKTFYPWIASFVYFSVYYGTMWAFSEYISPKFSMICLIQENKYGYNTCF